MQTEPTNPLKLAQMFKDAIAASVAHRKTLLQDWKENVNARVMQQFTHVTQDTVAVPEDWARTKQKIAQLMFQVPKILLTPKHPKYADAAPVFQAVLNHKLHHEIKAEVMLDECLADVVNAAGIMASKVGIEVVTEPTTVTEPDISQLPPEQQLAMLQSGAAVEKVVDRPVYECYKWDRISPASLLWPAEFTGSNWDDAPWLGHETWIPLEKAKKQYKLPADFKPTDVKPCLLSEDVQSDLKKHIATDYVKVQEIFYKAYLYDPTSTHPEHIRRIVFVDGHDQPVIHEDSTWQKYVEPTFVPEERNPETGEVISPAREIPGHYIGIRKLPIRVATLTYVSDLATPPSDSRAGRSQVRELIKSRSQMIRQRDRSIPIRWFDTNRVDTDVAEKIKSGEWQDFIPMNGPGERAIGEVARANYPRENFEFQNVIGSDLDRAWSLSNNQLASQSHTERSATEVNIMQSAANIRLEYEKARVARYVVGGVEVLAGLMQMFTDRTEYVEMVGPDGAKRMQAWDQHTVNIDVAFDVVPDSGDRIDPNVRQERILKLYNLAANDPTINREALTRQLVESYGMDPAVVMQKPPEPQPEKPNVSYRFGGDDMTNPLAVALMLKANPDLTEGHIRAAVQMIQDAMRLIQTPQQPAPPAPGGAPMPPQAPPEEIEPPETQNPILKRLNDGSRMAA